MAEPGLKSLKQMVQRVLDSQRETREDVREIKTRLGRLESEVANLHGFLAERSIRLDRFGDRLERVERRLEIADG
jgi:predicted nuclease with TOPRIM domain